MADLGNAPDGAGVSVDLDRFIGSHGCVIANSGGGKSGLLRKLLESTHGRIQHIVLDVEDEFYTLRERYDYVIVGGDGSDGPASIAGAAKLARAALEHGFSLIVQLNDFGADAPEYVAQFLGGLMSAPRALWHPVIIAIDEAQRIAPSKTTTIATSAVQDLMYRGRKRGFTALLASLRISEIDPGVRGMVNNWMLGRVGQALDRNTMADQLGFTQKEGREKLRAMEARSFWGFGPAIAAEPVLFHVADAETTVVKAGQAKVATPPAPEAMRAILEALAPPPPIEEPIEGAVAAVMAEAGFTDEMLAGVKLSLKQMSEEQRRHFVEGRFAASADRRNYEAEIETMRVDRARAIQRAAGALIALRGVNVDLDQLAEKAEEARQEVLAAIGRALGEDEIPAKGGGGPEVDDGHTSGSAPAEDRSAERQDERTEERPHPPPSPEPQGVTGGESAAPAIGDRGAGKLLAILATVHPQGMTREILALRAGINPRGSTISSYLSTLRQAGYITAASGDLYATPAGVESAGNVEQLPEPGPELARWWASKLGGVGQTVEVLLKFWPGWQNRDALAETLGINPKGSTISSYLGRLRAAKLLDESGKDVRLSDSVMKG